MQSYGEFRRWTMEMPRITGSCCGAPGAFVVLLGCFWMNSAQAGIPYEKGSVYNLQRYIPGYEASREIVSYPLGCSVNSVADSALQLLFPQQSGGVSEFFNDACVRHDLCYRHGYYTYGFSKDDCDREFAGLLYSRCYGAFTDKSLNQCHLVADILITAATKFGHLSYHSSDFSFRDYGYYYEYLPQRTGRFALFWAMLRIDHQKVLSLLSTSMVTVKSSLKREKPENAINRFFRKKSGLGQLLSQLGLEVREQSQYLRKPAP